MLTRTWRNWTLNTLLMGVENGALLENSLALPGKVKHRITI